MSKKKVLFNIIRYTSEYFNSIPKPYGFLTLNLKSGLDLPSIIAEVNVLLPQLVGFVDQFNTLVSQSGLNVITDSVGNMSIDVPHSMPDKEAQNISMRIGIIDRLITSHGNSINDLFKEGLSIENKLKANNPKYISVLAEKVSEFKKLNASYKH